MLLPPPLPQMWAAPRVRVTTLSLVPMRATTCVRRHRPMRLLVVLLVRRLDVRRMHATRSMVQGRASWR